MSKSFGDAFEIDVATRVIRLLTHYPHPGFLRVQYLPNGDYFLIGARTFADIGATRGRDQEMWLLPHDFKPGDRASRSATRSRKVWRFRARRPRSPGPTRTGSIRTCSPRASRSSTPRTSPTKDGQPALANTQEIVRAKAPECTLEAQDFRRNDTELIYTCYRGQYADVFGIELASRRVTTYRKLAGEYNEVEGIFPDGEHTLVESSREQTQHDSSHIDLWRLRLEPDSTDFVRMTRWGDYEGFKASNPVVAPDGKSFAFQSARSTDAAGVGYGIFVYTMPAGTR